MTLEQPSRNAVKPLQPHSRLDRRILRAAAAAASLNAKLTCVALTACAAADIRL